jgi:superfamily II DNA or RNA helicase
VASIATLYARAVRGSKIELPPADLIVLDEAHHARARTYRRILESYPNAVVIGLTATPCRGDGRGLGNIFDKIIEGPPIAELIAGGHLVPSKVFAPTRPDLAGVRVERGDYVESQLAKRMNTDTLVGDIIEHWFRLADRRRTVVFATGVEHSVHIRNEFRQAAVLAEHLDGSTPAKERDAILAKLAAGQIDVVVNAMILTEGWDSPEVACLVLARPTRSLLLYRQMVGRVLRPAPGKTDALILDHAGAVFEHGFVEEPITWTLHSDRRAENTAQTARTEGHAPRLTTCPECKATRFQGRPCEACGWRPQRRPAAFDVAEGELAHVDRAYNVDAGFNEAGKLNFYRQLLWIADERGYQHGWAAHKHREKFGAWPPRTNLPPLEPEASTRAWVRSRQIAFARAKAKQEGAAA